MPGEAAEVVPSILVRRCQLVALGLLMGIVFYLGLVLWATETHPAPNPPHSRILSYSSFGFLFLMAVLRFIVPLRITGGLVARVAAGTWQPPLEAAGPYNVMPIPPSVFTTDTARLCAVFQTGNVIALALLEASALLTLTAYLVEQKSMVFPLVGVAVLLMLQAFPTRSRIQTWVDQQRAVIEEMRNKNAPG